MSQRPCTSGPFAEDRNASASAASLRGSSGTSNVRSVSLCNHPSNSACEPEESRSAEALCLQRLCRTPLWDCCSWRNARTGRLGSTLMKEVHQRHNSLLNFRFELNERLDSGHNLFRSHSMCSSCLCFLGAPEVRLGAYADLGISTAIAYADSLCAPRSRLAPGQGRKLAWFDRLGRVPEALGTKSSN